MSHYALFLWPYKKLALAELAAHGITATSGTNARILSAHITDTKILHYCGSISKRWKIVTKDELLSMEFAMIATDKNTWVLMKKKWLVRRFKEADITKSDLEIKKKGAEIRPLDKKWEQYAIVQDRQDVELRSDIEFNKPDTSMKIGMMPAKLAASMISISGVVAGQTIYDPFIWLGTTALVANTQWINCLWSDLNVTSTKRNVQRWFEQERKTDARISLRKHDVREPLKNNLAQKTDAIVTEWSLWPIVTQRTPIKEIINNKASVTALWKQTISQWLTYFETFPRVVATLPRYTRVEDGVSTELWPWLAKQWLTMTAVDTYARAKQQVQRQIVIIEK